MSKYDDLMKRLGRLRPNDFVQWLCTESKEIQNVSFEDREFELTYRRVDLLYLVKTADLGEFYLHLEFQADLKPDFSIRMHEYSTRIRKEFKLPVKTVAIFLDSTQAIRDLEPADRCIFAGEVVSEFRYIKLVLPDEEWKAILSQGFPVLYPLIPLTKIPQGEERRALQEAIHCIEELPEQKLQGELAAALFLLGGYSYSGTMKEVIGEKLMLDLMQSVTYRELVEVAEKKGIKESIYKFLQARFGAVSDEIKDKLNKIESAENLDNLLEKSALAQSLDEFQIILTEMSKQA